MHLLKLCLLLDAERVDSDVVAAALELAVGMNSLPACSAWLLVIRVTE